MTTPIEETAMDHAYTKGLAARRDAGEVLRPEELLAISAHNAGLDAAAEEVMDKFLVNAGGWSPSRPYEKTGLIRRAILKRKL